MGINKGGTAARGALRVTYCWCPCRPYKRSVSWLAAMPCAPPELYIGDERWYEATICDRHLYKGAEQSNHSRRTTSENILHETDASTLAHRKVTVSRVTTTAETQVELARTPQNSMQPCPEQPARTTELESTRQAQVSAMRPRISLQRTLIDGRTPYLRWSR